MLVTGSLLNYPLDMNIVIMAGGGGTRLWPLSRRSRPKQFLDLGTGQTLLEDTYGRARALTGRENIYVATVRDYREQINRYLPKVDSGRIFYEPERRDTTAAFATITLRLSRLGQGEVPTVFMWSDHVFTNEIAFIEDLRRMPELIEANPRSLAVMGHVPVTPETTLGYIETGSTVAGYHNVYRVRCFKEKPDKKTAESFVAAGNYYWNLGYFSARPSYFLSELKKQSPEVIPALEGFDQALTSGGEDDVAAAYRAFPKVSIEYTLIEKAPSIVAVVGDYGWSDVGNWEVVEKVFGGRGDHAPFGYHVHVDSDRNYIYNATKKTVSLIGMEDVIVVVTDDAVLVSKKGKCHKVREVVEHLQKGRQDVL